MALFVSFTCKSNDPKYQPFIGSMEVPFDVIKGIPDIKKCEQYIKGKFEAFGVTKVTIINWKRFDS